MASRVITDVGAAAGRYRLDGGRDVVEVDIQTSTGELDQVTLSPADVAAALTPAERTALRASLNKLYQRALLLKGYV